MKPNDYYSAREVDSSSDILLVFKKKSFTLLLNLHNLYKIRTG